MPELPDIDPTQLLAQIYIMRLGRMLDSAYDRLCREETGMSGADMRVLFALRRAGAPVPSTTVPPLMRSSSRIYPWWQDRDVPGARIARR